MSYCILVRNTSAPGSLGCFKARTVHEASLEDVRRLEERRDEEATVLHQVERTETALRYDNAW